MPENNLDLTGLKAKAIHSVDKNRLTLEQIEVIAKQNTLHSAIASEFNDFCQEEKALFATLIYTALEQAIELDKPISASTRYLVTPVIYNDYLAHISTGNDLSPLRVLTYEDLLIGVKGIFERSLKYHAYVDFRDEPKGKGEKSLAICQARFVPSYSVSQKDDEIKEIGVDICVTIVHELNAILDKAKGSIVTALSLTNNLLNPVQKTEKDVN